ncbi:MAG: hydantoinase/oxoprolinase family protein [Methylotenera sp.]|uniref:hydantoinase/oxoprolinase family protein n=1 Tax=Methylotenera sp. TaxID=2051956 RepID=UPI002721E15C|nr:hydantoinase/oxoprolinase family protein [Methylotenera sp.]MDO9392449.1 hydantoinase/oxoprolinase family protein [Methylotenera sp.]MDP3308264.1 hydantoinase/oxoprolinase family protein [Methylotenera sp.]MDP3818311.1 hydantoinase/oxoprolinase family protein [Methylotenera sp.]
MNKSSIIGWDIGGAHLKAVLVDVTGKVLAASQVYCPLWRGLHELDSAVDKVLSEFNADKHVVTMTGELADIFQNRHAGVMQLAQFLQKKLAGQVKYYAGKQGFVAPNEVEINTANIASMNWLASVQYLAQNVQRALFLDIGSTTTDIALIHDGKAQVLGFNDAIRMQSDELVYTGVVRTPLMALAQKIPFAGQLVNVAAEHFATTADVYMLTGDLPLADNMADTADGAEKTIEASARRIARMIGCDAKGATISSWKNLAYAFKYAQMNQIKQAMLRQISLLEDCLDLSIVGAGAGSFLAHELANQLGFQYEPVSNFIIADKLNVNNDETINMAALCFSSYAVASLGNQC